MKLYIYHECSCLCLLNILNWFGIFLKKKKVNVSGSVQNNGWVLETVDNKDASEPEVLRIRGFKFNKIEQLETKYSEPGKFYLKAWTCIRVKEVIVLMLHSLLFFVSFLTCLSTLWLSCSKQWDQKFCRVSLRSPPNLN